jgi:hypothetical protein
VGYDQGWIVLTCNSTVCIVLVTAAAVVPSLGLPLITAITAMVLPYSGSLVGGVLYLIYIPLFGLMTSA